MNDTHVKSQLISTYSQLFISLSKLVEPASFNKVMEAMYMRPPAFALATQYTWDALLNAPMELLSDEAAEVILDGRSGTRFDYNRYLQVAQSDWEKQVGQFLWRWEEAEKKFGNLTEIGCMFRTLNSDEYEGMMRSITTQVVA